MTTKIIHLKDMTVYLTVTRVPDGFDMQAVADGINVGMDYNAGIIELSGLPPEYDDTAYKGQWAIGVTIRYELDAGALYG